MCIAINSHQRLHDQYSDRRDIYMMTFITQMLLMQVFVSGSNLQLNEKYGLQGLGGSIK
jgi:hypothetical protein